jgi:tetratricopeptide (TPR) repeat protein
MAHRRFHAVLTALLVMLALSVHGLQRALDAHRSLRFVDQTRVFLPNGKLLRWMSMGYSGMVGDCLWLRSVLYYGRRAMDEDNPYYVYAYKKNTVESEMRSVDRIAPLTRTKRRLSKVIPPQLSRFESRGLVDDIYPLLDRVATVDPHFIFPYIFGGVYVLMDTGDLDDAEALLKKGLRQNPDSWQIPFYLGWISWAYRGDPDRSREYMIQAVDNPGCPAYVYDLLGGVTREANQEAVTRSYLQGILESTDNPDVRSRIESVLKKLESEPSQKPD